MTYKNTTMKYRGGNVIASGGFGCVLKPGVKCGRILKSTHTKTRRKKPSYSEQTITKLMKRKYAEKEYAEIVKYRPILKKIDNYQDYFLVDGFTLCKPVPLNEEDLQNFDEKCSALKKMDITSNNVNSSLDLLLALNMPYGGIELGDFIKKHYTESTIMISLNNTLMHLLVKGLVEMNNRGVLHCDLKSSNILVLETKGKLYTRLIDWGLSTYYVRGHAIPKVLENRPFQYNVPFSNVLFTNDFRDTYNTFLSQNPKPNYFSIRTFVINYVSMWVEKRGIGHLRTINAIFKQLYKRELHNIDEKYINNLIEYDYTFYHIFEYITHILLKFTHRGSFDEKTYLYQVYSKNIDIWGFVMSYIPLLELLNERKHLTPDQETLAKLIRDLVIFVLEFSDEAIKIQMIVHKLHEMNKYMHSLKTLSSHEKIEMKSSSVTDLEQGQLPPEIPDKEIIREPIFSIGSAVDTQTTKDTKVEKRKQIYNRALKDIEKRHSKNSWM